MKRTNNVLWIIGVIILILGIIRLIVVLSRDEKDIGALVLAFLGLAVGFALTVSGLYMSISANKYNKKLYQKYQDKVFITTCHYCGHEVECYVEDFSEHRNYPEGFVYCPVCHKPLSINAFKVINEGRRNLPPNQYEYHYDEWEDD